MQTIRRWLRTPQAAEYVGLSASTLEKFRVTGGGPTYQKAGSKIVIYHPDDLDAWIISRRHRSTSDAGPTTANEAR
jgi:predicted DNA-binding transcriptional regulator AlpA